jgi:hypothetical protein
MSAFRKAARHRLQVDAASDASAAPPATKARSENQSGRWNKVWKHSVGAARSNLREIPMKCFLLISALSATAILGVTVATPAAAQATVTGAPKGTAPVTVEGYGPSSVIVCNAAGYCWHSMERYDYPPDAGVEIHPYGWQWDNGANYAWREHPGRGYWQGDEWRVF